MENIVDCIEAVIFTMKFSFLLVACYKHIPNENSDLTFDSVVWKS